MVGTWSGERIDKSAAKADAARAGRPMVAPVAAGTWDRPHGRLKIGKRP